MIANSEIWRVWHTGRQNTHQVYLACFSRVGKYGGPLIAVCVPIFLFVSRAISHGLPLSHTLGGSGVHVKMRE